MFVYMKQTNKIYRDRDPAFPRNSKILLPVFQENIGDRLEKVEVITQLIFGAYVNYL